MKRSVLLLSMFALWGIGFAAYIPSGTYLYLSTAGSWTSETYLSAYFYNTTADGNYVPMTAVAGETDLWQAEAPVGGPWTYVVFRAHNAPVTAGMGEGSDIRYRTGTLTWSGYQSLYEVNCDLCATEGIVNIATGTWNYFMPLPAIAPQQMGQIHIDSLVCHTFAGEDVKLRVDETEQFMQSQWFRWQDGAWMRINGTPDSMSATLPADTAQEAWFFFSGQRMKNDGTGVVNGDFEQGNTGFVSDYNYRTPSGNETLYDEGAYTITTAVNLVHSSAPAPACSHDHTTGSGNMMAVNGGSDVNKIVWEQTVTGLKPYTSYVFSAWVMNWDQENMNMAQLEFSINGQLQGGRISPQGGYGHWTQVYAIWNSGADTDATIRLVNFQNAANGNDFAIDDISLSEVEEYNILYRFRFRDCSSEPVLPDTCNDKMVYRKWNDVLFCDNHDSLYVTYQWYCDSIAIDGATRQFLYRPEGMGAGEYMVVAKRADGTFVASCPQSFDVVPRSADSAPVIPASVRRGTPIHITHTQGCHTLTLYDVLGRTLLNKTISGEEVQLSLPLGVGVYIVHISADNTYHSQRIYIY